MPVPAVLEEGTGRFTKSTPPFDYDCPYCEISFKYCRRFENHFIEKHPDVKAFVCQECERGFVRKIYLNQHSKEVHGKTYDFSAEISKRRRQRKYAMLEGVTCRVCGTEYENMKTFEMHAIVAHTGMKLFECGECEAKYSRSSSLGRHAIMKHYGRRHRSRPDRCFACKICNRSFERSDLLAIHRNVCENVKQEREAETILIKADEDDGYGSPRRICHKCGLKCENVALLAIHFRSEHPGEKAMKCDVCEKTFETFGNVRRHVSAKHPETGSPFVRAPRKYKKGIAYRCGYCGEEFLGLNKYEWHGAERHAGRPLFHCGICSAGFSKKNVMNRHVRAVHAKGYLRCNYCDKWYGLRSDLAVHESGCGKRSNTPGRKDYYCRLCDKTYLIKEKAFKWHQYRHHKYDHCTLCYKRYNRLMNPGGLAKHIAQRHPRHVHVNNVIALLKAAEECDTKPSLG